MAATASPYGLRPVNMQGGQAMSHGIRLMPIHIQPASPVAGYATNLFNGDLVKLASGLIVLENGTTAALPIGVFLGCEYEDPAMGLLHRNFWPASTTPKAGTTAWAYVCDDPDMLYEVQSAGAITTAHLGLNGDLATYAAGSVANGKSAVAMAATTPTASSTRPLRIVDFVRRPGSVAGDAKTDVIVRINTHANRTP